MGGAGEAVADAVAGGVGGDGVGVRDGGVVGACEAGVDGHVGAGACV